MKNKLGKRIVIYDFETDGLWNKLTQPIEVAVHIIEKNGKESDYHSLIKIRNNTGKKTFYDKLPPLITSLTGITDELLQKEGREMKPVFKELNEIFNKPNTLVVGYNIVTFDNTFLNYYLQLFRHKPINNDYCFDVLGQWKATSLNIPRRGDDTIGKWHRRAIYTKNRLNDDKHTLEDAVKHYGVGRGEEQKFHRAKPDVESTTKILFKQLEQINYKIQLEASMNEYQYKKFLLNGK